MPKALASCTILVLGEFGHSPYQIREWIKYHGGTQVKGLNDSTTHIVCSEKNWKANHPTVLAAIKLDDAKTNANSKSKGSSKGSKKLNIVTWDWLEDCMIKRRNFAAKKYEWRAPVQKASRLEELIKQWGEMTGVEMSARLVYGAGGKTVNVNATVKGKAKAKGKGNEKSKGKALSPVEQELAKGESPFENASISSEVETDHWIATQQSTAFTTQTPPSTTSSSYFLEQQKIAIASP
jgi:hypothetical protein